jgi:hypothetical protein
MRDRNRRFTAQPGRAVICKEFMSRDERFASCACGKLRSVAQENYARFDVRLS